MNKENRKDIEAELNRLADENEGKLIPQSVVDAARDPENPMHAVFEWDDAVAGEKWRLEQARTMIRDVKVRTVEENITLTSVAYVHDPRLDHGEAGYVALTHVMTDAELAHETLTLEFKMAAAAIKRARSVAKVLGNVDKLDHVLAQVVRFPADIRRPAPKEVEPQRPDA